MRRILTMALAALLLLAAASPAFAIDRIDLARDNTLSILFVDPVDDTPLTGVSFYLFRVCDVDEWGAFQNYGEPYLSYVDRIETRSQAAWSAVAMELGPYCLNGENGVLYTAVQETDADGRAVFTGLSAGLYLVACYYFTYNDLLYESDPFLVGLPDLDENDVWVYDTATAPKPGYITGPAEIPYPPDGPEETPEPTPTPDETPAPDETPTPDETPGPEDTPPPTETPSSGEPVAPTDTPVPDEPTETPASERLAQTGVLWWPVPVLLLVGLTLILLGVIRRGRRRES